MTTPTSSPGSVRLSPIARNIVAGLGAAAHLVVFVMFYLPAGLIVPLWGIALLWVLWAALAVLVVRWFRPHPLWVLAIPVAALLIWVCVVSAGGAFLGWTA